MVSFAVLVLHFKKYYDAVTVIILLSVLVYAFIKKETRNCALISLIIVMILFWSSKTEWMIMQLNQNYFWTF
jgi:hypothetical protein